jgi:chemotaxis response regulator CheB
MNIKVLIADDQALIRSGLRAIIESEPGMEVVGEAGDGAEAVEAVRRLRPDVALMDIRMPRLDGVAATRALLRGAAPVPTKILILTTFHLDAYVTEALRAGASGFLLKEGGRRLRFGAGAAARVLTIVGPRAGRPGYGQGLTRVRRPGAERDAETSANRYAQGKGEKVMGLIDEALRANATIARDYDPSRGKPPAPKIAIVTCADPRLTEHRADAGSRPRRCRHDQELRHRDR